MDSCLFQGLSVRSKTHKILFTIWTRIANSLSPDDNRSAKYASKKPDWLKVIADKLSYLLVYKGKNDHQ